MMGVVYRFLKGLFDRVRGKMSPRDLPDPDPTSPFFGIPGDKNGWPFR